MIRSTLFLLIGIGPVSLFAQATLQLKPGPELGKDAQVGSLEPFTNYGGTTVLAGYAWTQGGQVNVTRGLLAFDLSSIPPGSAVLNASLSLYSNPTYWIGYHSGDNGLRIQRVVSGWSENEVSWSNQPAVSDANVLVLPPSADPYQDYLDLDVTLLVQDMVNDPADSHGFRIQLQNETIYRTVLLSSSDHAEPARWPELQVTYLTPSTAIGDLGGLDEAILYPVPNDGRTLWVNGPAVQGPDAYFQVLDACGRSVCVVYPRTTTGASCLDFPLALAPGSYVLVAVDGERRSPGRAFVVR